jgi:hypothetical protein
MALVQHIITNSCVHVSGFVIGQFMVTYFSLKHVKQPITITIPFPGASEPTTQVSLMQLKLASIISFHAMFSTCL